MSCHWSSRGVLWCRANGLTRIGTMDEGSGCNLPPGLHHISSVRPASSGDSDITYWSWYMQMVPMSPHMRIQMVFSWVPFLPWSSHVIQVASTSFFMTYVCSVGWWHSVLIPKIGPLNLTESLECMAVVGQTPSGPHSSIVHGQLAFPLLKLPESATLILGSTVSHTLTPMWSYLVSCPVHVNLDHWRFPDIQILIRNCFLVKKLSLKMDRALHLWKVSHAEV